MRRVLIPVDASNPARTSAAVATAVSLYQQEPVNVHLLSVQPVLSGHVAMFFESGELPALQQEAGIEDLAQAKALLDLAGVPYRASIVVGRSAETIARRARELGCYRIIIGQERSLASKMLGNLADQVRRILGDAADCQVLGS